MNQLNCEEVLRMVWRYLDGEIDEGQYQAIRSHVAGCVGCGPRYAFQVELLALVENKCREGPVPEELKQRLFRLLGD